jgi:serine protease inhibitor
MRRLPPAAIWLLILVACSDGTAPTPAPEALKALPRSLTADEASIITANNAFTLALFQKASAAEPRTNVFISPLSASMALGMTMNGARNETFTAMRTALQFGQAPQGQINAGYKSLMELLLGLDPAVESRIANSIWYRNTLPINPAFVGAARDYFNADVSALDFNAAASVKIVNDWVSRQTATRIPTILESIGPNDVMYLINAIYFKASWRNGFDRSATTIATFNAGDGVAEQVPMMHLEAEKRLRGRGFYDGSMMMELPYGNSAFNMEVYLPPDTTTVERYIERLTPQSLKSDFNDDVRANASLWMPRVKLEYQRLLNPDLIALGMGVAFSGSADFTGMTTTPMGLAISKVLQKTFLTIDEEGTEAAAVTVVDIFVSAPPGPMSMRVDRPYMIVIRERLSGTIMFIGKINTL